MCANQRSRSTVAARSQCLPADDGIGALIDHAMDSALVAIWSQLVGGVGETAYANAAVCLRGLLIAVNHPVGRLRVGEVSVHCPRPVSGVISAPLTPPVVGRCGEAWSTLLHRHRAPLTLIGSGFVSR